MDHCIVALDAIDLEDGRFEIRKFAEPVRLRESLDRYGILDPVWLRKKDSAYLVVDGFKRLRWALQSGGKGVFCRIFPQTLSSRELWVKRIEKKLFEPEIGVAEKAQIISVLLDLFQPPEIPRPLLCALNVSPRTELLRKWVVLARETEVLRLIESAQTAERAALEIADWDRESIEAVLDIFRSLRCSASIQVELAERIEEIAIRVRKHRTEIIQSVQVRKILSQKELNHREKTQALRDLLRQLRYPRLSARERRFREGVEALALPAAVRIIPPPAFEGSNWRMELCFAGPLELRDALDSARDTASSDLLDALIRPRLSGPESEGSEE